MLKQDDKYSLSVIMTVYNGEEFLSETLDAIFAQTYKDFELVVCNNGSTDSTQAILDSYDDARLKVIHQTLEKPTFGDGIRLAYANASGEFIAVNDGDDVPTPDRLEKQVAALRADENLALVSGWFEEIDENGKLVQTCELPKSFEGLLEAYQGSNPLAHSTYMYRKSISDKVGGYEPKYHYGSDFALALEMIKAGYKIKVLPKVVLKLRVHSGQASNAPELGLMRAYEARELFREAANLPGLSGAAKAMGRKNVAKRTVQYAFALLHEKKWGKGLGQVFSAITYSPIYGTIYFGFRLACALRIVKHPVYS
ncbi:glycosyltransferase [Terasakiella sp. A23]|uniref:glycosyltransferase family 2 protein n=1 Tax=Terasakiella sp. FCG-A23 TaxID=3080561 RepID=UPI0029530320|nr:glycosyltransferase [Terasakiella sp. A23]MDV7340818.1 glycosyltransferase [Terasakiella sp. A23]